MIEELVYLMLRFWWKEIARIKASAVTWAERNERMRKTQQQEEVGGGATEDATDETQLSGGRGLAI